MKADPSWVRFSFGEISIRICGANEATVSPLKHKKYSGNVDKRGAFWQNAVVFQVKELCA